MLTSGNLNKKLIKLFMNSKVKIITGVLLTLLVALSAQQLSHYIGENLLGYKKSPISAVIIAIIIGMFWEIYFLGL